MTILYLNKFRGFEETFLSLKDVNFFVGENSTGKTSVLKAISTIFNHKFWFVNDLNSIEGIDFGYFNEIANGTTVGAFFEIGIFQAIESDVSKFHSVKFKFINRNGLPYLKEICIIQDGYNVQAEIEKDHIKYRYKKTTVATENVDKSPLSDFKSWVRNNGLESIKPEVFEFGLESEDENQSLYLYLQEIITSEIKAKDSSNSSKSSRRIKIPHFVNDLFWLAPIRIKSKRTYDNYKYSFSSDGTHTPYLLKQLLNDNNDKKRKHNESVLKRFGSDSGMFDQISINQLGGKNETSPFELHIKLGGRAVNITNVGYGVSQIIPILAEIMSRPDESWFVIQQPEIHLHPRAQAAFGDLIFKSAIVENKKFIIETHSDYTIDRFRIKLNKLLKEDSSSEIESQVVYFERNSNGQNTLCEIPILNDGTYSEDQPDGFRDFFIREQLDLIQL
jgi:AAA15 family ATPase/GTPase